MKRILALVAAAAILFIIGCGSPEKCLDKYGFNSCDEFRQVMKKNQDRDLAIKYHDVSIECNCK